MTEVAPSTCPAWIVIQGHGPQKTLGEFLPAILKKKKEIKNFQH